MDPIWMFMLFFTFVLLVRRRQYVNRFNKLPCHPVTFGVVGNLIDIAAQVKRVGSMGVHMEESINGLCLIDSTNECNGGLFTIWLGPKPLVILFAPEFIEQILISKNKVSKGHFYSVLEDWMGEGLVTSTGNKWFSHRKLVNPAFTLKKLDASLVSVNRNSNVLVKALQDEAEKNPDKIIDDIRDIISQYALVNICNFALAKELTFPCEKLKQYIEATLIVHDTMYQRAVLPYFNPLLSMTASAQLHWSKVDEIDAFSLQVIEEKLTQVRTNNDQLNKNESNDLMNNNKMNGNFIDILLNKYRCLPKHFTMKDVHDEVNTITMAGFDTTATLLTGTMHLLGWYPHVQKTMQNELDALFDQKASPDDDLTMDDVRNLSYTEAVIKEANRLCSTVGMIARLLEEDTHFGEHVVPAGTEVLIPIMSVHKNRRYWNNPERFDPERFLNPHPCRHAYAYIPFSGGPRNCIGQKYALIEMKVALAKIFHRFTVTSLDSPDEIKINPQIIRRFYDPVRVQLHLRR